MWKKGPGRAMLPIAICCGVLSVPARSVEAGGTYDDRHINAQPLITAKRELEEQIGVSEIVMLDNGVPQVLLNGVTCRCSSKTFLDEVLAGTGLTYRFARSDVLVLEFAPATQRPPPTDPERLIPEVRISVSLNSDRARSADDPQPYHVAARAKSASTTASTVDAFIRDSIAGGGGLQLAGTPGSVGGNTGQINLHGLGPNETVVLLNGRRIAGPAIGGGPMQVALGAIPLSAIDRVEILPQTASGIYGGGATAGTVNVIFRGDFKGVQLDAGHGGAVGSGAEGSTLSLLFGRSFNDDRTSVFATAGFVRQQPLLMDERKSMREGRDRVVRNNPDYAHSRNSPPLGGSSNIVSGDETPLPQGLGFTTSVPAVYKGSTEGLDPFTRQRTGYNLDLADDAQFGGGASAVLQNGTQTSALFAQLNHALSDTRSLFVELLYASTESKSPANSGGFLGLEGVEIPGDLHTNPFHKTVRVTVPTYGADGELHQWSTTWRATVGVKWKIAADLTMGFDYGVSAALVRWTQPGADSAAKDAIEGKLDVFQDPHFINFTPYLYRLGTSWLPSESRSTALRWEGVLTDIKENAISFSALLEHRTDVFGGGTRYRDHGAGTERITEPAFSRQFEKTDSMYAEFRSPLKTVELQAALRLDRVSMRVGPSSLDPAKVVAVSTVTHRFTSLNPTFGVRWSPLRVLAFRSSASRGTLNPSVSQLLPGVVRHYNTTPYNDPLRVDEKVGPINQKEGGNPQVDPERANTWSAGVILTPRFAPGLRLSLDRTVIRKSGDIESLRGLNLQQLESLFVGRVVRAPRAADDPLKFGVVTDVDLTNANIARTEVLAWDAEIGYQYESLSWGSLDLFASGAYQPRLIHQLAAGEPRVNDARPGAGPTPLLSAVGGFRYTLRQLSWSWSARYIAPYAPINDQGADLNQGADRVAGQVYHDVALTWHFGAAERWWPQTEVKFAVANVLNTEPPFDASAWDTGLYSLYGDPRLRNYQLLFSFRF